MTKPDLLDYQPRLQRRPSPKREFVLAVGIILAAIAIILVLGVVAFLFAAIGPR